MRYESVSFLSFMKLCEFHRYKVIYTNNMSKRQKNYVNNKELREEIILSLEKGELTRKALNMLILIAENANYKLMYVKEEDKDDCIQHAKLDILKYWKGYDPKFPNAFAYYTQMAKNGYAKGWNKLYPKKYHGTISMDNTFSGNSEEDTVYSLSRNAY